MRTTMSRSIVATLAASLALSSINLVPAQAASQSGARAKQATTTEFSARRHHWRHGNAAVLGAVAGVFGAIAVAAAADRYNDYYYGGTPYPYYGPGYYGYHHWHHHWHHHW